MRGDATQQLEMLSPVTLDTLVPRGHPIRDIRSIVDGALSELSPVFDAMYAQVGRPSIPPARRRHLLSSEHFTFDGTLLEAWASLKSVVPRDDDGGPPSGKNPDVDFRGQRRTNDTHASTTDPEARLARKGNGQETKLAYAGHVLMENRHGLIVDIVLTPGGRTRRTQGRARDARPAGTTAPGHARGGQGMTRRTSSPNAGSAASRRMWRSTRRTGAVASTNA